MKTLGIAGWSGSGKTTLILSLLGELRRRGLRVSTIKHAHHKVEIDTPGKDSYEHRAAGAHEVMLVTGKRFALMHDFPDPDVEMPLHELVAKMAPADLLLIEGFKTYAHPKLEVHRPSVGKPLLYPNDPHIVGVASDEAVETGALPCLPLNDPAVIADFVMAQARPLLAPQS